MIVDRRYRSRLRQRGLSVVIALLMALQGVFPAAALATQPQVQLSVPEVTQGGYTTPLEIKATGFAPGSITEPVTVMLYDDAQTPPEAVSGAVTVATLLYGANDQPEVSFDLVKGDLTAGSYHFEIMAPGMNPVMVPFKVLAPPPPSAGTLTLAPATVYEGYSYQRLFASGFAGLDPDGTIRVEVFRRSDDTRVDNISTGGFILMGDEGEVEVNLGPDLPVGGYQLKFNQAGMNEHTVNFDVVKAPGLTVTTPGTLVEGYSKTLIKVTGFVNPDAIIDGSDVNVSLDRDGVSMDQYLDGNSKNAFSDEQNNNVKTVSIEVVPGLTAGTYKLTITRWNQPEQTGTLVVEQAPPEDPPQPEDPPAAGALSLDMPGKVYEGYIGEIHLTAKGFNGLTTGAEAGQVTVLLYHSDGTQTVAGVTASGYPVLDPQKGPVVNTTVNGELPAGGYVLKFWQPGMAEHTAQFTVFSLPGLAVNPNQLHADYDLTEMKVTGFADVETLSLGDLSIHLDKDGAQESMDGYLDVTVASIFDDAQNGNVRTLTFDVESGLPVGNYHLTISRTGGLTQQGQFTVAQVQEFMSLSPNQVTAGTQETIRVSGFTSADLAEGFTVLLYKEGNLWQDGIPAQSIQVGNGEITFSLSETVPPDTYQVEVKPAKRLAQTADLTVNAATGGGEPVELNLSKTQAKPGDQVTVSGIANVSNDDSVQVLLYGTAGEIVVGDYQVTDASVVFSVPQVSAGDYGVKVRLSGGEEQEAASKLQVVLPQTQPSVTLDPAEVSRGYAGLVFASGFAPEAMGNDATVTAWLYAGGDMVEQGTADAGIVVSNEQVPVGVNFKVKSNLDPGDYQVKFRFTNGSEWTSPFLVNNPPTLNLTQVTYNYQKIAMEARGLAHQDLLTNDNISAALLKVDTFGEYEVYNGISGIQVEPDGDGKVVKFQVEPLSGPGIYKVTFRTPGQVVQEASFEVLDGFLNQGPTVHPTTAKAGDEVTVGSIADVSVSDEVTVELFAEGDSTGPAFTANNLTVAEVDGDMSVKFTVPDAQTLPPGTYLVKVRLGDNTKQTAAATLTVEADTSGGGQSPVALAPSELTEGFMDQVRAMGFASGSLAQPVTVLLYGVPDGIVADSVTVKLYNDSQEWAPEVSFRAKDNLPSGDYQVIFKSSGLADQTANLRVNPPLALSRTQVVQDFLYSTEMEAWNFAHPNDVDNTIEVVLYDSMGEVTDGIVSGTVQAFLYNNVQRARFQIRSGLNEGWYQLGFRAKDWPEQKARFEVTGGNQTPTGLQINPTDVTAGYDTPLTLTLRGLNEPVAVNDNVSVYLNGPKESLDKVNRSWTDRLVQQDTMGSKYVAVQINEQLAPGAYDITVQRSGQPEQKTVFKVAGQQEPSQIKLEPQQLPYPLTQDTEVMARGFANPDALDSSVTVLLYGGGPDHTQFDYIAGTPVSELLYGKRVVRFTVDADIPQGMYDVVFQPANSEAEGEHAQLQVGTTGGGQQHQLMVNPNQLAPDYGNQTIKVSGFLDQSAIDTTVSVMLYGPDDVSANSSISNVTYVPDTGEGKSVTFMLYAGLPSGQYEIIVQPGAPEATPEQGQLTIGSPGGGQPGPGGLFIDPASKDEGYEGQITVTAVGFANQEAFEQNTTTVELRQYDQLVPDSVVPGSVEVSTGEHGKVITFKLVNGLHKGRYQVVFRGSNDVKESKGFEIKGIVNVVITVKDAGDKPAQGHLQIRPKDARPDEWDKTIQEDTDSQGVARLSLDPGVTYILVDVGYKDGVFQLGEEFTVLPGEQLNLAVSLATNVEATVYDANGDLVVHKHVAILPDDGSGHPVQDFSRMASGETNDQGVLKLKLKPGHYHVVGMGDETGHTTTDIPFEVTEADGFTGELRMPAANVKVFLLSTGTNGPRGVPMATVHLRPAVVTEGDYSQDKWGITDTDGMAGFQLPAGTNWIVVEVDSGNGPVRQDLTFTVPADGDPALDITISMDSNVALTLLNEDGDALADSFVNIKADNNGEPDYYSPGKEFFGQTDENGLVNLNLKPGTYWVVEINNPDRHIRTKLSFTVTDTGYTGTLQLASTNVRITVTNGTVPVERAMIQIRPAGASPDDWQNSIGVQTDTAGVARLNLPPGDYVIWDVGTSEGVTMVKRPFSVPTTGMAEPIEISLATNLRSEVRDEEGDLMVDSWVTIKPDNGSGKPENTWDHVVGGGTGLNGILSLNLEPGNYHVVEIGNRYRHIATDIPFTVDAATGYTGVLQVPSANVKITVVKNGNPVGWAMLQIRPANARPEEWDKSVWVNTDSSGVARLNLTAGARYILVDIGTPDGVVPIKKEFTVPKLDLVISLATNVQATILDEAGNPMPFSWVQVKPDKDGQPDEGWERAVGAGTNAVGVLNLNLDAGTYWVTEIGNPQRYVRTKLSFTVNADTGFQGNLQLPTPNVQISVTKSGNPVGRAMLQVRPADARPDEWQKSVMAQTDANGVARLDLTAGTRYLLWDIGTPEGVTQVKREFTTPAVGQPTLALNVSLDTNVQAPVRDEAGNLMTYAWVTIKPDDGTGQAENNWDHVVGGGTGANGVLNLNLSPGRYHVVEIGNPNKHIRTDIPFTVTEGDVYNTTLQVPAANVVITVTGEGNAAVSRAWLQVRPASARPDEWDKSVWAETDNTGVAKLNLTAGARYVLIDVGTRDGVTPVRKEFTVPAAGQPALDLPVSLATNVRAVVKDEAGNRMLRAWVTIKPDDGDGNPESGWEHVIGAGTSEAGGVLSLNLSPGVYHVIEIGNPQQHIRTDIKFEVTDNGYTDDLQVPSANVVITVTGQNGAELSRAWLQVRPADARPDEWQKAIWAETDGNGVAKLRLTDGVRYVLVDIGSPAGVTPIRREFTAPEPDMRVSLANNVQLTLTAEDGVTTLGDAWVTIKPDDGNGKPQADWAQAVSGRTNGSGLLSLSLAAGDFHVVEIGTQQRHIRTDIPFTVDALTGFTGTKSLPSPNVNVMVTDANGQALGHANVQVRPADARPDEHDKAIWAETDDTGVARLTLTAATEYVLVDVGAPDGIHPQMQAFTAPANGAPVLTIDVALANNVTLTLLDQDGITPIANARLRIRPKAEEGNQVADWGRSLHGTTDGSGVLTMSMPPATYEVVEVATNNRRIKTLLEFTVDADTGFNGSVQLPAANTTGVVRDPVADVVIPYARVAVAPLGTDANDFRLVTWFEADVNGRVEMVLSEGDYQILDVDTNDGWYHLETPVLFTVPTNGTDIDIPLSGLFGP